MGLFIQAVPLFKVQSFSFFIGNWSPQMFKKLSFSKITDDLSVNIFFLSYDFAADDIEVFTY